MYIDHYEVLKAMTADNLPQILTIDHFNNQYERTEALKAIRYPAQFIEFPDDIPWEQMGNNTQRADVDINFHLVLRDVGDAPANILELAQAHYQYFNGKAILSPYGSLNPIQLSTSLVRMNSRLIRNYDQLKIVVLTYGCSIVDLSAAAVTTPVSAAVSVQNNNQ